MHYVLMFIVVALLAAPVHAETYVWEDEQGTMNFAEDLGKVPKQFRKKARLFGAEEAPAAAVPAKANEAAPQQPEVKSEIVEKGSKGEAPAPKEEKKAVYGDKEASVWRAEFGEINADLRANEKQLEAYRSRLQDTAGMSRTEYLSLNNTIRATEQVVLNLRKKLDNLKQEASKAGVPAEVME